MIWLVAVALGQMLLAEAALDELRKCLKDKVTPVQDYCTGIGDCSDECLSAAQDIQPTLETCCDEMADVLPAEAIEHCKTKVQSEPVLPSALECPTPASSSSDPYGSSESMSSMVAMPAIAVVFLVIGGIMRRMSRTKNSITHQPLLA